MKKLLKNKKIILSGVFTALVLSILVLNVTVVPEILKVTPDASALEKVADTEINIKDLNDVLGNIISEKDAIDIAKKGVREELAKEKPSIEINPCITDFDTAKISARYITERAFSPTDDPVWIVIIVGQKEDFTAPMPDEVSIEDVSSIAVEKGLVWEDENGKVMAYYEKLTELTYVEVNAVTGKYNGYKCLTPVSDVDLKNNIEWLNERYNTDFGLSEMNL